jgi:hypothetical protein
MKRKLRHYGSVRDCQLGDNDCSCQSADSLNRGQQLANFVVLEAVVNVSFKFTRSHAHREYILAGIADLPLVRFRLMLANRGLGSADQSARERLADAAPAIKADRCESADGRRQNCVRGGITSQNGDREFSVQTSDVPSEFRKGEVDRSMEVTHSISEVLDRALT